VTKLHTYSISLVILISVEESIVHHRRIMSHSIHKPVPCVSNDRRSIASSRHETEPGMIMSTYQTLSNKFLATVPFP